MKLLDNIRNMLGPILGGGGATARTSDGDGRASTSRDFAALMRRDKPAAIESATV